MRLQHRATTFRSHRAPLHLSCDVAFSMHGSINPADWLHLHYRDKALMLARGVRVSEFFLSLLCKEGSHSAGRQMSAHLSNPALNLLSLVGPVGNNALQAVGVAAVVRDQSERSIVVCCVG